MKLWPCGFKIEYTHLGFASARGSLTLHLKLWPCGFEIDYTHLGFTSAVAVPIGSDGDPRCIFFTLNTCQATFISNILWNNCRNWKKWKCNGQTEGQTDLKSEMVMFEKPHKLKSLVEWWKIVFKVHPQCVVHFRRSSQIIFPLSSPWSNLQCDSHISSPPMHVPIIEK